MMAWRRKILAMAVLAVACTAETDSASDDATDPRSAVTDGGTWTVSILPDPDPIPANAEFALVVTVDDGSGGAVGTRLDLTADMPAHGHAMNQEPVVSGADGEFRADGMLFHMTGEWRIFIEVDSNAGAETVEMYTTCCD